MDRYDKWDDDLKYFESAKKSSVKTGKQEEMISVSEGKKTSKLGKFVTVAVSCIVVVIMVGSGMTVKGWIDNNVKDNQITHFLEENYNVLEPNIHRSGGTLWYDTLDIAKDIQESDNMDMAIYSSYRQMDYKSNMDDVIRHLQNDEYETFNEYLTYKGYVDEEGNPSREKYNEAIDRKSVV